MHFKRCRYICFSDSSAQKSNSKAKEIADYYECIKEAKNRYMFKYILVLEDDAEPSTPTSVDNIIYAVIPNVMQQKPDVIFAKLFYSFGYQGFSANIEIVAEVISFVLLLTISVYGALFGWKRMLLSRHPSRKTSSWTIQNNSTNILIATAFGGIALILVLILGRQSTLLCLKNFLVPHRISRAHSDQTTAILYPRTKLNEVLNVMDNRFSCVQKDTKSLEQEIAVDIQLANVFDSIYNERNVMIWVHGDFFNHIGYYTSLHFKGLHINIANFAARYVRLPDIFCDTPML